MANSVVSPITSWEPDSTAADTNTPQGSSSLQPGGVTDLAGELRVIKSEIRSALLNLPWVRVLGANPPAVPSSGPPVFINGTQFSLVGDWSPFITVGQRLRALVNAGSVYGTTTAVSVSGGITTVTMAWDSGSLDGTLSEVQLGPAGNVGLATQSYVQNTPVAFFGATSGQDTYAVTLSPVPANRAATIKRPLIITVGQANTGAAATLNVNGFGAFPLIDNSLDNLIANQLRAGITYTVIDDGANYIVQNSSLPPPLPRAATFQGAAAGTNTYTVNLTPAPASANDLFAKPILVQFVNSNTGACTLNPNGLGAFPLIDIHGNPLTAATIGHSASYYLMFDNTNFMVQFPSPVTSGSNASSGYIFNGNAGVQVVIVSGASPITANWPTPFPNLCLGAVSVPVGPTSAGACDQVNAVSNTQVVIETNTASGISHFIIGVGF